MSQMSNGYKDGARLPNRKRRVRDKAAYDLMYFLSTRFSKNLPKQEMSAIATRVRANHPWPRRAQLGRALTLVAIQSAVDRNFAVSEAQKLASAAESDEEREFWQELSVLFKSARDATAASPGSRR
jgi:hypothetical protein